MTIAILPTTIRRRVKLRRSFNPKPFIGGRFTMTSISVSVKASIPSSVVHQIVIAVIIPRITSRRCRRQFVRQFGSKPAAGFPTIAGTPADFGGDFVALGEGILETIAHARAAADVLEEFGLQDVFVAHGGGGEGDVEGGRGTDEEELCVGFSQ
jgi:hypothetical protein